MVGVALSTYEPTQSLNSIQLNLRSLALSFLASDLRYTLGEN